MLKTSRMNYCINHNNSLSIGHDSLYRLKKLILLESTRFRHHIKRIIIFILSAIFLFLNFGDASADYKKITSEELSTPTRVVTLGTGTPDINADRAGAATAVIVDGKEVYLFDSGSGFMERLGKFLTTEKQGIFPNTPSYPTYMYPTFLNKLFLTHLDSDHIVGLPELLLRGWILERKEPVKIWGPKGTKDLVSGIIDAYQTDIEHRASSLPIGQKAPYEGIVSEFGDQPGVVYEDKYVTITAFNVDHGSWSRGMAVGYRIDAPDKTIVISGDTRPSKNLIKHAKGADILVHEVMSQSGVENLPKDWRAYMHAAHTTTQELAEIAKEIQPHLVVMTHILFLGESAESIEKELGAAYQGNYALANDADVFE